MKDCAYYKLTKREQDAEKELMEHIDRNHLDENYVPRRRRKPEVTSHEVEQ